MRRIILLVVLSLFIVELNAQNDTIHSERTLKEVVITSKRPTVEFTPQGTTYRIDGLAGQSNNLYDIIASLPGVTIDNEGNLIINGKSGGEILFDGKVTHLSGRELAAMLRSMPAVESDKIDVITQPSARYDAAGVSGIIDIHSKKNKMLGMHINVNMSGSVGQAGGANGSISYNYKTKHWNPYFTYSYYTHKHVNDLTIDRAFFQERMSQKSIRKYRIKNHDVRLGCDYMLNDRSTFNVDMKIGFDKIKEKSFMQSLTQQTLVRKGNTGRSDDHHLNLTTGINFQHRFADDGVWSASADYFHFSSDQQQNLYSEVPDTTVGKMPSHINIFSFKADLELPLNSVWNIESGLKMSNVWIRNEFMYTMAKNANTKFNYDEDTYAAYFQTNYHTGKWKVTAGLRMEATYYHIYSEDKLQQRDTTNSKNNICLFPSLNIVYSIREGQSLMLSYSKRVIRPNYADLNPFVYIFDDYTLESGNTDLRPAFSHNFELSLVNQKFGQITGFLSLMDDALVKGFAIDENECVRTFRRNFADYLSTGLRYQSMFDITKRWNASVFAACVYNRYKWREDGAECTNSRLTPIFSITQSYSFPFSLQAQLKASYQGKMAYGQVAAHASSLINFSLQKTICNGNGTITLFANDIFDSQREKLTLIMKGKSAWCQTLNHNRLIGVGFSWKFVKGVDIKEKKHKNAIDEINRVYL